MGGFALAALATTGVVPAAIWGGAVLLGAMASLALLLLFFHRWLVLGVAIDLVLIWALIAGGWSPASLG